MSDFARCGCLMGEMQELSDAQLLREYAQRGCEPAFREIVTRHTALVYSAALRCVNSPDVACDIAQSVFTDLSRKARPLADKLAESASLVGWLFRSTRFTALNHLRDDRRRLARERQAMEQLLSNSESAPDWDRIRPVLDEAMDNLDDEDRDALLLRYFKNQDFRAVGVALGVSDDAAQKRVTRAVERLREFFAKRGVTVGASGLVVIVSANAVQAAPVGLAVAISSAAALAGTAVVATTTATATQAIAMTTLQKTLITAAFVAAVGTAIYEARQVSTLRTQVQTLQQQQAPLAEQIEQLSRERDGTASKLIALADENERLNRNAIDLLRLRGEVAQLRKQAATSTPVTGTDENDWVDATLQVWRTKLKMIKQRFDEWPGKETPELGLLTEGDWLTEIAKRPLETEPQVREALSSLRYAARAKFGDEIEKALGDYAKDNGEEFPENVDQLAPYLSPALQPMLEGYEIAQPGRVKVPQPNSPNATMAAKWALVEKGAASAPHDASYSRRSRV
ncbi:MAG: sigma-70 family RNA polymerase sigma factor [Verrucomicrobia bacterium]|nr:sigma-70 family RNA polymerase sigma factor [Verrucomicrobiota bacterium]